MCDYVLKIESEIECCYKPDFVNLIKTLIEKYIKQFLKKYKTDCIAQNSENSVAYVDTTLISRTCLDYTQHIFGCFKDKYRHDYKEKIEKQKCKTVYCIEFIENYKLRIRRKDLDFISNKVVIGRNQNECVGSVGEDGLAPMEEDIDKKFIYSIKQKSNNLKEPVAIMVNKSIMQEIWNLIKDNVVEEFLKKNNRKLYHQLFDKTFNKGKMASKKSIDKNKEIEESDFEEIIRNSLFTTSISNRIGFQQVEHDFYDEELLSYKKTPELERIIPIIKDDIIKKYYNETKDRYELRNDSIEYQLTLEEKQKIDKIIVKHQNRYNEFELKKLLIVKSLNLLQERRDFPMFPVKFIDNCQKASSKKKSSTLRFGLLNFNIVSNMYGEIDKDVDIVEYFDYDACISLVQKDNKIVIFRTVKITNKNMKNQNKVKNEPFNCKIKDPLVIYVPEFYFRNNEESLATLIDRKTNQNVDGFTYEIVDDLYFICLKSQLEHTNDLKNFFHSQLMSIADTTSDKIIFLNKHNENSIDLGGLEINDASIDKDETFIWFPFINFLKQKKIFLNKKSFEKYNQQISKIRQNDLELMEFIISKPISFINILNIHLNELEYSILIQFMEEHNQINFLNCLKLESNLQLEEIFKDSSKKEHKCIILYKFTHAIKQHQRNILKQIKNTQQYSNICFIDDFNSLLGNTFYNSFNNYHLTSLFAFNKDPNFSIEQFCLTNDRTELSLDISELCNKEKYYNCSDKLKKNKYIDHKIYNRLLDGGKSIKHKKLIDRITDSIRLPFLFDLKSDYFSVQSSIKYYIYKLFKDVKDEELKKIECLYENNDESNVNSSAVKSHKKIIIKNHSSLKENKVTLIDYLNNNYNYRIKPHFNVDEHSKKKINIEGCDKTIFDNETERIESDKESINDEIFEDNYRLRCHIVSFENHFKKSQSFIEKIRDFDTQKICNGMKIYFYEDKLHGVVKSMHFVCPIEWDIIDKTKYDAISKNDSYRNNELISLMTETMPENATGSIAETCIIQDEEFIIIDVDCIDLEKLKNVCEHQENFNNTSQTQKVWGYIVSVENEQGQIVQKRLDSMQDFCLNECWDIQDFLDWARNSENRHYIEDIIVLLPEHEKYLDYISLLRSLEMAQENLFIIKTKLF